MTDPRDRIDDLAERRGRAARRRRREPSSGSGGEPAAARSAGRVISAAGARGRRRGGASRHPEDRQPLLQGSSRPGRGQRRGGRQRRHRRRGRRSRPAGQRQPERKLRHARSRRPRHPCRRTASGDPVPANFQPTSVTFIGPHIGAVIGQAGTPGHCTAAPTAPRWRARRTTARAGTGVSAPLPGARTGASGVSQLRFLDTSDGWAFGPQLWVTHDGGAALDPGADLRAAGHRPGDGREPRVRALRHLHGQRRRTTRRTAPASRSTVRRRRRPVAARARRRPRTCRPPRAAATSASLLLTGGPGGGTGYLLSPVGRAAAAGR